MVGYAKDVIEGKNAKGKAKFSKFVLEGDGAEGLVGIRVLNCDCHGGKLRRGIGVVPEQRENGYAVVIDVGEQEIIGGYDILLRHNSPDAVFVGADGILYTADSYYVGQPHGHIGEHPSYHCVRGEETGVYHLFAGSNGAYYTRNAVSFTLVAEEDLCGACAAGKRFFLLLKNGKVRYSAACNPEEWGGTSQEGGELYLPMKYGNPRGIAGHGAYAYIFMERGIYRVTVKAKASDFVIEPLPYDGSEVIARSPISVSAGVFFLTVNGLYRIKGEKVERICDSLSVRPKEDSVAHNGYCGDTVIMDYVDEDSTTKRLVAHTDGSDGYFAEVYGTLCGSEYFCMSGLLHRFVQDSSVTHFGRQPYFETGWETLGHEGQKQLKKLTLRGKGSVRVKLSGGGLTYSYYLAFVDGLAQTSLHQKSDKFFFCLQPMAGSEVRSMTIDYVYPQG